MKIPKPSLETLIAVVTVIVWLAFTTLIVILLGAEPSQPEEERCFSTAMAETNYCRTQEKW